MINNILAGWAEGLPSKWPSLDAFIAAALNIATALAGLIAVTVLIYGGVKYMLSTGNEQKTEKAQNTIIYAIVGIVIIGLSRLLVEFILRFVTGEGPTGIEESAETMIYSLLG
jgi:TRAP-type C4-dicarboxylate transport system permease small subunit